MATKAVAKVSWTVEPKCPIGWTEEDWNAELVRRGYPKHGIGGYLPQGLFTIRVYDAKMRKSWHQAQRHTNVIVVETIPIGTEKGRPAKLVCRVVGSGEQLDSLMCYPCVELATHVMSARVPMGEKCDEGGIPYVLKVTAQGAGPEKIRPAPSRTMLVSVESDAEAKLKAKHHASKLEWVEQPLMPRSGETATYQDSRAKKGKPCGSDTEYESMVEARKASDHTNIPTTAF